MQQSDNCTRINPSRKKGSDGYIADGLPLYCSLQMWTNESFCVGFSFEISIDAREAGNVHSTKIHGVLDNNAVPNAFTNEYSTVFNAVEVAQYDFVTNSATAIDLEVTPANANTTEYVINITAIRRYT